MSPSSLKPTYRVHGVLSLFYTLLCESHHSTHYCMNLDLWLPAVHCSPACLVAMPVGFVFLTTGSSLSVQHPLGAWSAPCGLALRLHLARLPQCCALCVGVLWSRAEKGLQRQLSAWWSQGHSCCTCLCCTTGLCPVLLQTCFLALSPCWFLALVTLPRLIPVPWPRAGLIVALSLFYCLLALTRSSVYLCVCYGISLCCGRNHFTRFC